ncbi:hypothetical protein [Sandaracinus amylolyticus]|uniref:hypothetical protein n=1 Tax=Sandaracinus amylolyticus TaxID=927083 RepID=UPI001F3D6CDE|nr:hypothetical protein [Sandaracinus amylolyticus]UJR83937.1 Hypothetical protein I5071_60080 [Sandaracinus amylolyticus]
MTQEIRAIHRALTGEELRIDGAPPTDPEAPSEGELTVRFAELAIAARSIPSIAFELWALGLDEEHADATSREGERAISHVAARADAEE